MRLGCKMHHPIAPLHQLQNQLLVTNVSLDELEPTGLSDVRSDVLGRSRVGGRQVNTVNVPLVTPNCFTTFKRRN